MKNIFVALLFFLASVSAIWKEVAEFLGLGIYKSKTELFSGIDYNVQLQHYAITGKVDQIKDLLKNPKVVPNSASLVAAAMSGNTEALEVCLHKCLEILIRAIVTTKRRKSKSIALYL